MDSFSGRAARAVRVAATIPAAAGVLLAMAAVAVGLELDRRDDLGEIDFDERQRAEEEMAERDRREGRFVRRGQLGAAMESEDGESTPARPALAAT
jgi:hypothetical protein